MTRVTHAVLVATLLTLPVLVLSMTMVEFPYRNWLLLALSAPVLFWAGAGIYRSACRMRFSTSSTVPTPSTVRTTERAV